MVSFSRIVEARSAGARSARTWVFSAGLAGRSGQSGGRRVSRDVVPRFVTQPSSVAPVPEWSRSGCSFLCDPFVDAYADRTSLVPGAAPTAPSPSFASVKSHLRMWPSTRLSWPPSRSLRSDWSAGLEGVPTRECGCAHLPRRGVLGWCPTCWSLH